MAWPRRPHRYYFISRKNKHLKHHYWLFHLRLVGLVSALPLAAGGMARLAFQNISGSSQIFSSKHTVLHMTLNTECVCVCVVLEWGCVFVMQECPHVNSVMSASHRMSLCVSWFCVFICSSILEAAGHGCNIRTGPPSFLDLVLFVFWFLTSRPL